MLPYTPFTSENLTAVTEGATAVTDLSSFMGADSSIPNGKQVIFFSAGVLCLVFSLILITRGLIESDDAQAAIKTITKVAVAA